MTDGEQTNEQEVQLGALFQSIGSAFKRLEKAAGKADTVQDELKGISASLQDGRALIKDFEREARIDGMAPSVLAARKRDYVQALNRFIEMKKPYLSGGAAKARRPGEALSPKAPLSQSGQYEAMAVSDMLKQGQKEIQQTDDALKRTQRIVEDTIQVATETATTLDGQTKQMEGVLNSLDEIHFSLKKANQVIRDITRRIATDRCIMALTLLAVLGLVAMIILKVLHVGDKSSTPTAAPVAATPASRRLMMHGPSRSCG